MKIKELNLNTIEEWNNYLENLSKERGRNISFNLKEIPRYHDYIAGFCNEVDEFGRIHGEFKVRLDHFLKGESLGCRKCSGKNHPSTEEYRETLNLLFPKEQFPRLSFEKSIYNGRDGHSIGTCSVHGDFEFSTEVALRGGAKFLCQECNHEHIGFIKRVQEEEVKRRILESFPNSGYDLSKLKYVNRQTRVTVICPIHGEFDQYPELLYRGYGCPSCRENRVSKGEKRIIDWLNAHHIKFLRNIIISGEGIEGRNSNKISPDFQIIGKNNEKIWIEFNGEQHYRFVSLFHSSIEDLEKQQKRDRFLIKYCKENNIQLIIIDYTQFNEIESILSNSLNNFFR